MYHTTAFLYDATAGFEAPDRTCDDVVEAFRRCGLELPGKIGDLGCGTGLIALLLAERGWDVYGIDVSDAMMDMAREKAARLPEAVRSRLSWMRGDISAFQLPSGITLDGAICMCNTINHLVEWRQVEGFIQATFRALRPGGVLVLDSDTFMTFQDYFNHPPVVTWDDGIHRMTRACDFDEATGRARHVATLEQADGSGWRLLHEETMFLQHHWESALKDALLAAGFTLESVQPYNPYPERYKDAWIPKMLWTLFKPF